MLIGPFDMREHIYGRERRLVKYKYREKGFWFLRSSLVAVSSPGSYFYIQNRDYRINQGELS